MDEGNTARYPVAKKLGHACLVPIMVYFVVACQITPGSLPERELPAFTNTSDRLQFSGLLKALAFFQGGDMLLAGGCEPGASEPMSCERGLVSIWSLKGTTTEEILRLPRPVTAMAVSPDGTKWVAGDSEGRLILSSSALRNITRPFHQKGEITALAFSPDAKWVASGSLDPSFSLGLMDMKTGGVVKVKAPFDPVSSLVFSRDGKELGIGMQNGKVVTWNFTSHVSPVLIAGKSNQAVNSVTFSPDDRLLAYGRQDGRVVILDRTTGETVSDIKCASSVLALAFSPDGRYLALGQDNGKVALIESQQAREIWSRRHIIPIVDLAYSPDGMFLAVAAQQGVFLYHVGDVSPMPVSAPQVQRPGLPNSSTSDSQAKARVPAVSSRQFARFLQITQDEYLWLLPFDRIVAGSVEAMVNLVPGAKLERQPSAKNQILVRAGGRSWAFDLNRLRQTVGRSGAREAVKTYESVQAVLLSVWAGPASVLEDAAVSAALEELGPGLRLEPATGQVRNPWEPVSESVEDAILGEKVNYLKLSSFNRSTHKKIRRWVIANSSSAGRAGAYVLDLRDNSGTDLDVAIETASAFLPKGRLIAKVIARKTGEGIEYRSDGSGFNPKGLVILVNERTTGTAEMVACAIRSAGVGVLVGRPTAGVDDIYGVFPLPGGERLRVSTGRFICPDGQSVRWKGRVVDVNVNQSSPGEFHPIGVFRSDSLRRPRFAAPVSADALLSNDPPLRVGIELALCFRNVLNDYRQEGHSHDVASLLSACQ